jgi:hydrogenase-4 component E
VSGAPDLLLLAVVLLDLYIVATGRLHSLVRSSALQGLALALLPVALWGSEPEGRMLHIALMSGGTFVIKVIVIPLLLRSAIREANVRREVDPFISLHGSLLLGAALVGISFWFSSLLILPRPAPSGLLLPAAFSTLLLGFLVLVTRRKAVTQVVGYLMLENGVFLFGQMLARDLPFAVELGILLDLLVGVFVMGIAIHHISREFEDIDTERLAVLKETA